MKIRKSYPNSADERATTASEMRRGRAGCPSAGDKKKFMHTKEQASRGSERARGERREAVATAVLRHVPVPDTEA